ncbi:hypothetical protein [Neodiprion sertifer nucleopolyhedrovirus]|uniref:Uncharacterized protein n=1 Tax=Neodiprion sertifer nucleopolyhedrovirus TaxID=111874 RepID=Q6JKE5_9CBAC|nr:hypothetical protein NeseNPV_gp15 [Neodiprion sertifer nucleopolyhedrovirus]AAQ96392.1 hypothetical protein [Neodiprion sertifer nucleopolyhedrovirus]
MVMNRRGTTSFQISAIYDKLIIGAIWYITRDPQGKSTVKFSIRHRHLSESYTTQ